jgi:TM2 domain-containing membrane protein YozV
MDAHKVDMFILANNKYFEEHNLIAIREQLLKLDESKWSLLQMQQFHDPIISLIVSILAGSIGIDRFLVGDIGLGVAKLLTCGGLGIWIIVDWFLIMGVARQKNMEKLQRILY